MKPGPAFIIKFLAGAVEIVIAGVFWSEHPALVLLAFAAAVIGIGTYALELHTRLTNKGLRWQQQGFREGLTYRGPVKS